MSDAPAPRQASILPVLGVIAFGAALPMLLTGGFHLRLATLVWIYAILCMGFNLLYGYSGQISLGQQAFYAIGAYAFGLLRIKAGWLVLPAAAGSLTFCAIIALLIGMPLLRLRTHYLAMATLAFGLIFFGVAMRWIEFTGGSAGIAVPPLTVGGQTIGRLHLYYLILCCAALILLLHDFIVRGHVGRALQAIRDDETAAAALGVDVVRYKLRIFVLAAVLAAAAGVCFSLLALRVDPSLSDFRVIVAILTVAVVGGLGTRFGPIIGSIFVIVVPQLLVGFGELETLVYGVFILVFLIFLPHGLSGYVESGAWRAPFRRFARQSTRQGGTAP